MGLDLSQLYNADESGLFWCAFARKYADLQIWKKKNSLERKISKELVIMQIGSHMPKPVIGGKSKHPSAIKNNEKTVCSLL